MKQIIIRGARENNLKDVDLDLPREKLVVITGLSGSGKSSLAFDTLYAEGQRRYVESLSAYARQFLDQMSKPDVDLIDGLSPAISIEQKGLSKNPRSTVGTVTEIYDYLRLLYARVGRPHCPRCGKPIASQSVQQIVDQILKLPQGTRFSVLAPVVRQRKGEHRRVMEELRREGYARVNIDDEVVDLQEEIALDKRKPHTIEVYVDRLVLKAGIASRLADSIELALKLAEGIVKITPLEGEDLLFSERLACIDCGVSFADLSPRSFSFNNPAGACPSCSGLGALREFDEDLIVPAPDKSLREGAIEPWDSRSASYYQQLLETLGQHFKFDLYTPYAELSPSVKCLLMQGSGELELEFSFEKGGRTQRYCRPFEGVIANLQRRMDEQERRRREGSSGEALGAFDEVVDEFHRYMQESVCPDCQGARLSPEARHVLIEAMPIQQITRMNIAQALEFFTNLKFEGQQREIAARLLREIQGRISFLSGVGLDYLTLDRPSATLSGGEGQRVRLATQIGSLLVGVLYILDEPSIGLHKRDHGRLLKTLIELRDKGNSVIVVEHDEETIAAADYVVDMGPGAGTKGGEVVAAGTVEQIKAHPKSLTGLYLSGKQRIPVPKKRRVSRRYLTLKGARQNNLKGIEVQLPLGVFCCVTGVSGSGKSTLIIDTLLPALRGPLHNAKDQPGDHDGVDGIGLIDKVISIDQNPIGRTPRSNPATYTGVFTKIRELFAALPESKVRGYKSGRYSFNVKGGRCEACQGDGILRIAMHFLPDVFVPCEVCGGRRYNHETLQVKYKGHSIADVLGMTANEAREVLESVSPVRAKLKTLYDVGLGYLTLGQPANTLSGGEAQRLKMSKELSRKSTGRTLYILDEPTTGLHLADIHLLLQVLNQLVKGGNTVIVIEHQLDVIKSADYVIDLGPEGGEGGGQVIAAGTPEEVARTPGSHTGAYLAPLLKRR